MRSIRWVVLGAVLLVLSGCDSSSPVEEALRFQELRFQGDMIALHELLSAPDREALPARRLAEEGVELDEDLYPGSKWISAAGVSRVFVDSARMLVRRGDTAVVETIMRHPNGAWISAEFDKRYSFGRMDPDSLIEELREKAPLVTGKDTLVLAREGDGWRVVLNMPRWNRILEIEELTYNSNIAVRSLKERGEAGLAYFAMMESEGFNEYLNPELVKKIEADLKIFPWADSLEFREVVISEDARGKKSISMEVENLSGTPLTIGRIAIEDQNGNLGGVPYRVRLLPHSVRTLKSSISTTTPGRWTYGLEAGPVRSAGISTFAQDPASSN